MPKPAARVSDLTQHGGVIMPPGAIKTMIEMLPAARITDMHTCPMVNGVVPHVGGPIIMGSPTVFIEFLPAARVMDQLVCVGPPDQIAKGAMKTFIGEGGGGGGAMVTMPSPDMPDTGGLPSVPGSAPGAPAAGNAGASEPNCTSEGDPVDVATGRMFTRIEEFAAQGSPAFRFQRFYSTSGAHLSGAFGYGWLHNLEERLEIGTETLTYCDWQGRRVLFPLLPPDMAFLHHLDENITLRRTLEGYDLDLPDGRALRFALLPDAPFARLTAILDAGGQSLQLTYEGALLRRITDGIGNQYLFETQDGRHISAILFRARGSNSTTPLARYTYDNGGCLASAADALGFTTRYYYDSSHRMTQKTDRNGFTFFWQYDAKNRCTRAWGRNGLFDQTFLYSETEPRTTVRNARGHTTNYEYNDLGMVTRVVDAQGNVQKYEYSGTKLIKHTDALGRVREYTYDQFARVVAVRTPGGGESQTTYAPDGSRLHTDAEGHTLIAQQQNGQVALGLAGADAPLLTTAWDPATRTLVVADGAGNVSRIVYDDADRVLAYTHPDGRTQRFEYDARGNRTAAIDPAGAWVRFGYDAVGRLTKVERDGGSGFQFHYDPEGNLSHFVDGNGRATQVQHAALEHVTAVTDPAGNTTRYDYDEGNRLRKITDARAAETLFDYDELGRIQRILRPDGRSDYLTFDPAGQLRRYLDSGGMAVDCEYDPDGNLISLRWVDGTALEFAYDKNGRIVRAQNADTEVTFAYDGYGRVICETQDGALVEYVYDDSGALTALRTPAGEEIRFAYDACGRLVGVTDLDGGVHQLEYADAGPLRTHRFPNGLIARYAHSRLGLTTLATLETERASAPMAQIGYRYDGNDAVTEVTDSELGQVVYRYDAAGRVQQAQHTAAASSETFAYDPNGNLTARDQISGLIYDRCNRFQGGPGVRCVHDGRGNLTQIEQAGRPTLRCFYNGPGLMTRTELADGTVVEYAYDPFGRRILKRQGATETRYLWAGHQLLGEITSGDRDEARWYVFLPHTFLPLGMRVDGVPYYFHTDHRGAPTRVSDANGELVWLAEVAVYGEARLRMARIAHSLRLPGQYFDPETGLHYNRARYYHPYWGRYLAPDPLGFQGGLNLYLYADNDPINNADPLGMAPRNKPGEAQGEKVGKGCKQAADDAQQPPLPQNSSPMGDVLASNPTPPSKEESQQEAVNQTDTGDAGSGSPDGTTGHNQGKDQSGPDTPQIEQTIMPAPNVPPPLIRVEKPGGLRGETFQADDQVPQRYREDLPRFQDLSKDPDHNGAIGPKSRAEAIAGLEAELQGVVKKPITRGPKGIEFYDADGTPYDVKTPITPPPGVRWKFNSEQAGKAIQSELRAKKANPSDPPGTFPNGKTGRPVPRRVILDSSYMKEEDHKALWDWLNGSDPKTGQPNLTNEEKSRIIELKIQK